MYSPKFTTKRVLGLSLAAALVLASTVALAGNSQAAVTAATVTPATGTATAANVVTVRGKGFSDATGTLATAVTFSTLACPAVPGATAAASFNVTSSSTLAATTASLAAGSYNVCVYSAAALLSQGTYTTAAAPTVSALAPLTGTVVMTSPLGGTVITVTGTGFTTKSKVSVGGVAAKTTYVSSTGLSAVLPAHAGATLVGVSVTSEYGTSAAFSTDTVSYVPVITVASPAYGSGAANSVINLTGSGFNSFVFNTATAADQAIILVPGGTTLTTSTVLGTTVPECTVVTVTSDKTLSCKVTSALSGAYSLLIVSRFTGGANWGSSVTRITRSATYTAAAF